MTFVIHFLSCNLFFVIILLIMPLTGSHNNDLPLYCFSINWPLLEPKQGEFNAAEMKHYKAFIAAIIAQGITPLPLLVDDIWPDWFHQKGGFTKSENIVDVIMFALYFFDQVDDFTLLWWLTFNEPARLMISRHLQEENKNTFYDLYMTGICINNILEAHCALYNIMKHKNSQLHIGLIHAFNTIKPSNPWNPFQHISNKYLEYLLNEAIPVYFNIGKFNWLFRVMNENAHAPQSIDFFGMNYYAPHSIDNLKLLNIHQTLADNENIRYDTFTKQIRKPIYTAYGSTKKPSMITQEIYNVLENIKKSYNIKGYFLHHGKTL